MFYIQHIFIYYIKEDFSKRYEILIYKFLYNLLFSLKIAYFSFNIIFNLNGIKIAFLSFYITSL